MIGKLTVQARDFTPVRKPYPIYPVDWLRFRSVILETTGLFYVALNRYKTTEC
jgi:hypothetical protein